MPLDRQWEKFRGGPMPKMAVRLRVTINRECLIYMNAKAYEAFNRPESVALYYNRDRDSIALVPDDSRSDDNFPVIERGGGFIVYASPFIVHHRIKINYTERFSRPEITTEGHLILDLRDMVSVARLERTPWRSDAERKANS
ncbi:MAG: hypothetical protein ABL999_03030 [Pyrinomonadaceae bacterium]